MALEIQFPDPNQAEKDGLVAVGGNLSPEFLLAAYTKGIFPWFNDGEPILWWSPDPRMVLFPPNFKQSASLKQSIRNRGYKVMTDKNFRQVITSCSKTERKGQKGTWITDDMIEAYVRLHEIGYAHSFETYHDNRLIGGLYGISLGKAFFGESMFFLERDASKVALFYLNELMLKWDFHFIDVQQSTTHLRSLGAKDIPRNVFLEMLDKSMKYPTKKGKWDISLF